ncbi:DUF3169 family protein [Paenibacillus sp. 1781tsa1]|uniref:DUF3169 family protein n=1 Tax=Paenibacillus sp. 1781tsa1 TaxID=2953810 RepID=UPI00209F920D|nr:DUF3169 family protein [Paenibacillus sp. 1781tsa1]MCP1182755.1 DUF3169 family protein [Paenibacillus sp. 1781tsa1]
MNRTTSPSKKNKMRLPLYAAGGTVVGFLGASGINKIPSNLNWTLSVYYDYDLLFALLAASLVVMMLWNIFSLSRTPSVPPMEEDTYGESDSLISPAERSLGKAMILSGLSVIVAFTWAALALSLYASHRNMTNFPELFNLVNLIVACISIIIVVVLQTLTVKRYNRYFPDRALDLNSRNMKKDHFEKLDEGEKWIVYRAAYRSFQMMNVLLGVGMVSMVLYSVLFTFAPFPIVMLSVIWIANIGIYYRETYRASNQ